MSQFIKLEGTTGHTRATALFFHGLEGDPTTTWQCPNVEETYWPRWLLEDIPGLRVSVAAYNASSSNWRSPTMSLTDRAENLLASLALDEEIVEHPIILIGHSLGGLIIKQIIRSLDGRTSLDEKYEKILKNLRLVVFLGVPHSGSGLAKVISFLPSALRPSNLTKSLGLDDSALRDLNTWYRDFHLKAQVQHLVFSETQETGFFRNVVSPSSSDPGLANTRVIPIDASHTEICKPTNRASLVYAAVLAAIQNAIKSPAHSAVLSFAQEDSAAPVIPTKRGTRLRQRIGAHQEIFVEAAEHRPFTVLLCGPSASNLPETPSSRLLEDIRKSLTDDGFDVVLGENAGINTPQINTGFNSLSNELEFVKTHCNAVVLIAETAGNWCELGLFSWHLADSKKLRDGTRFFVLIDESHSKGNDFVKLGPFAYANAFGKAEFADFSQYDSSEIVSNLQILRSVYAIDKRGRPRATAK